MIKEKLKRISFLVKFYHWIIGYNASEKHWCRVVMDETTEALVKSLPFDSFETLEISGDKWREFGFKNYQSVSFPKFDLCNEVFPRQFDFIIAEQIFEHFLWPHKAGRNVAAMVKDGGYFLITTPFLIKIHNCPGDCTRWSPLGLKHFLAECGFELDSIQVGSWGNRECVVANFDEWMPYNPKQHSLTNDQDFPIVVWALAKKRTKNYAIISPYKNEEAIEYN